MTVTLPWSCRRHTQWKITHIYRSFTLFNFVFLRLCTIFFFAFIFPVMWAQFVIIATFVTVNSCSSTRSPSTPRSWDVRDCANTWIILQGNKPFAGEGIVSWSNLHANQTMKYAARFHLTLQEPRQCYRLKGTCPHGQSWTMTNTSTLHSTSSRHQVKHILSGPQRGWLASCVKKIVWKKHTSVPSFIRDVIQRRGITYSWALASKKTHTHTYTIFARLLWMVRCILGKSKKYIFIFLVGSQLYTVLRRGQKKIERLCLKPISQATWWTTSLIFKAGSDSMEC